MTQWCTCAHPLVRCDDRGCLCEMCGLPEDPLRDPSPARPVRLAYREISHSYPHLWIARKFLLDYGTVLSYADALEKATAAKVDGMDVVAVDTLWQERYLTVPERRAVATVWHLAPAVRAGVVEAVLDARALWRVAQREGMAAALAV